MSFYSTPLLAWTDRGLYCEKGGFYIDPHRAVDLAVVTHAHSDHARRGCKEYICESSGLELLKTRLGKSINARGIPYRESFQLGEVKLSFHSAGHILGSSQVRVEYGGEVWVASGDYKREADPSCEPFETVPCDVFITEATFGTQKFIWDKSLEHGKMIAEWWRESIPLRKNCILFGYSLGKAQRILAELYPFAEKPILIHSTITELTECYRREGRKLALTSSLTDALEKCKREGTRLEGEMILTPPSVLKEEWTNELGAYETAFASGWMQNNSSYGSGYGNQYDRGFVMSDHADWNDLNRTIQESGAKKVFVQHRKGALIRHLRKMGIDAQPIEELTLDYFTKKGGVTLDLFEGMSKGGGLK